MFKSYIPRSRAISEVPGRASPKFQGASPKCMVNIFKRLTHDTYKIVSREYLLDQSIVVPIKIVYNTTH